LFFTIRSIKKKLPIKDGGWIAQGSDKNAIYRRGENDLRLLLLKHFDFDDASAILTWAKQKGHDYEIIFVPEAPVMPDLSCFDCLILLGGPMSVYEEDRYDWLRPEKDYVHTAIEAGKMVLGICLGAQILAEILGGKVYRKEHKEIGWHLIQCTGAQHFLMNGLPDTFYSFQWHGDYIDAPEGATILAYSEACPVQAFSYGQRVLGLQFHLETTISCLVTMLERWTHDLQPAPYVQSADLIRRGAIRCEDSAGMLAQILERYEQLEMQGALD